MNPSDMTRTYRTYLASVVHFHLAAAEAGGLGPSDYQASSMIDLDGPLTTGQLAENLGLSPSATTRVVDRLVAAGIAERRVDPTDRRRTVVAHTGHLPDGLAELLDRVRGPIGEAVASLTEEQQEGLVAYFRAAMEAYTAAARE
ncbi:MarR family winged helix-turn-helix transcriptional regulator [Rhodococcus rhodnii]|uniref:MarR family winged helix-turn-helix transcriptional regulator n=1 Tax=Rhodococcus rhodnii TaxID=38312 RepID=UPI0014734CCC|nr:MarR family transcriptional regulator [Rhodococcus rhodnii]